MDYNRIRAANDRLMGHKRVTPLLSSPFLDDIAGKRVFVKPECLQHTGSFKYRGAFSAVSALPDETRAKGVIAFSSGNHAQGVVRYLFTAHPQAMGKVLAIIYRTIQPRAVSRVTGQRHTSGCL